MATTDRLHYLGVVDVTLLDGDVTDQGSLVTARRTAELDEVYYLAAQSFVGASWRQPALMTGATGVGAVNVLEAIRIVNAKIRFYQASTNDVRARAGRAAVGDHTVSSAEPVCARELRLGNLAHAAGQ